MHTDASDGVLSPRQLVTQARQLGLDLISITDHDTFAAYGILGEGSILPMKLLPGIEVSSMHNDKDVHILGYGCNMEDEALSNLTKMYHEGRRNRAHKIVEKLNKLGIDISIEDVMAFAGKGELIARPHVAQALIKKGYVAHKAEAFERYIGDLKPAYEPKPEVPVQEVIMMIQAAKGFAVVAHPGKLAYPDAVHEFIEMGLDGIEALHPDHSFHQVEEFTQLALTNGLFITAGSDFHGDPNGQSKLEHFEVNDLILGSVSELYQEYLWRKDQQN